MRRFFIIGGALVLFMVMMSGSTPSTSAAIENRTAAYIEGDSMTYSFQTGTNFGTNDYMTVDFDGSWYQESFVKFDVSSLPTYASIDNATLYLWCHNINTGTPDMLIRQVVATWNENSITWDSSNAYAGALLDTVEVNATGQVAFDVTSSFDNITGDNLAYSIRHVTGNEGAQFRTKEHSTATERPYLQIDYTPPSTPATVFIENFVLDNGTTAASALDRDNDGYLVTGDPRGTKILVNVEDNNGIDNLTHVRISILDSDGDVRVDNVAFDNYATVNTTTRLYEYRFSIGSVGAITDADMGWWDVKVEALDVDGGENVWQENDTFFVDDFLFSDENVENLVGHQTHIELVCYTRTNSLAPDHVTVVDNINGTYNMPISEVYSLVFENTYTTPQQGKYYAYAYENSKDGIMSDNKDYRYPNFNPSFVSTSTNNAIIDNHASTDNAVTSVEIEVVFLDPDGFDDFTGNDIYVGLRATDNTTFLENVIRAVTVENENYAIFSWVFDADDYDNLTVAMFGVWGVSYTFSDNWFTGSGFDSDVFIVDDYVVPIGFTPTNPYAGWDVTVAGTSHRSSGGGATVGNHRIVDAVHGTFWEGSGNAYTENYGIPLAEPNQTISVTVIAWEGVLDGENTQSYTTSTDQKFEVTIRFEENYEIVDWIPDENRQVVLEFIRDDGVDNYTLTSNPENVIFAVGENLVEFVRVYDNGAYWRKVRPSSYGGTLTLIIAGDYSNLAQFQFSLQDVTTLYSPPDGIMLIRKQIGDNLAEIHDDLWDATWKMWAWLWQEDEYQIWVIGEGAPLRLVGPLKATNSAEEKVILINPVSGELISVGDYISWSFERLSATSLRIQYLDNLTETTSATVTIYDAGGTEEISFEPDNSWFILTWAGATGSESYSVNINVEHTTVGNVELNGYVSMSEEYLPAGFDEGGTTDAAGHMGFPFGLAALGSTLLIGMIGMLFDQARAHLSGMAMLAAMLMFWSMGWYTITGNYATDLLTIVVIGIMVLLFALTRRRRIT